MARALRVSRNSGSANKPSGGLPCARRRLRGGVPHETLTTQPLFDQEPRRISSPPICRTTGGRRRSAAGTSKRARHPRRAARARASARPARPRRPRTIRRCSAIPGAANSPELPLAAQPMKRRLDCPGPARPSGARTVGRTRHRRDHEAREIKVIGVIGAGQMGSGIAQVAASAGLSHAAQRCPSSSPSTPKRDRRALEKLVAKGKITSSAAAEKPWLVSSRSLGGARRWRR